MKRLLAFVCIMMLLVSGTIGSYAAPPRDTTAPAISSATPADGQIHAGISPILTVKFNENILKGRQFTQITLTDNSNKAVSLTLAIKDNTLTATPNSRLTFATEYKLILASGAVKDKSGNASKQIIIRFETISRIDSLKAELGAVVNALKKITVSNPGALETLGSDWVPLVSSDSMTSNTVFAAGRKYGYGRIMALGKEEILLNNEIYALDNLRFLKNAMTWLNGNGKKRAGYSTGHQEYVDSSSIANLKKELEKEKFTVRQTKLSGNDLKNLDILIIGNAWSGFTTAEISAVRNFVANGGGLVLAGLGWSFEAYNPNKPYPMEVLSTDFGVKWAKPVNGDTTETYNDNPVFTVFYPNIISLDTILNDTMTYLSRTTAEHAQDLPRILENDPVFKSEYVKAHLLLAKRVIESDAKDVIRQKIYDFCKTMAQQYPQYFSKKPVFVPAQYPTLTWLRERFLNTWISALDLQEARKNDIAQIGGFEGKYLDIWKQTGIYIADNNGLDDTQKQVLLDTLTAIPAKLHNTRIIAVENCIQPNLVNLPYAGFAVAGSSTATQLLNPGMDLTTTMMQGPGSSICISNVKVADYMENSFPENMAPGNVSLFSGVLYHELNHIVDFYFLLGNTAQKARREELLKAAGDNPSQYLRSMFESGFFTRNPYEFIASISNEWLTDSAKTVELGLKAFDAGFRQPINQALFFAGVYAVDGNTTCFYLSDPSGKITRTLVPFTKNDKGRITSLTFNGTKYGFVLDANGMVSSYTVIKP